MYWLVLKQLNIANKEHSLGLSSFQVSFVSWNRSITQPRKRNRSYGLYSSQKCGLCSPSSFRIHFANNWRRTKTKIVSSQWTLINQDTLKRLNNSTSTSDLVEKYSTWNSLTLVTRSSASVRRSSDDVLSARSWMRSRSWDADKAFLPKAVVTYGCKWKRKWTFTHPLTQPFPLIILTCERSNSCRSRSFSISRRFILSQSTPLRPTCP